MTSVQALEQARKELDEKVKVQPLDDYQKYVGALKNTTPTGFLEFKPRDAAAQAKYSAMSPSWEGIESTNSAIARGEFALDAAEPARLRETKKSQPPPQPEPEPRPSSSCVIQ